MNYEENNMRRVDREMSREFAIGVIDGASFGTLALWDEELRETYSLPLSIVRIGNTLYFHSAMSGRKVELLKGADRVSVSFVGEVAVPNAFSNEDLREIVKDSSAVALLISRVFTTQFESAIVTGKPRLVEDEREQTEVLKAICEKYTPDKMEFFQSAISSGLKRVNIYAVEIENISGKRKKLDASGEEMKYGRME